MDVVIRDATEADVPAIVAIYNEVIATSDAIWREEPVTIEDRLAWLGALAADGYPVLVALDVHDRSGVGEAGEGPVVGYASLGPFRPWPGYHPTVEHSIHVRSDRRGAGVGAALLGALVAAAVGLGKERMVAGIDGENEGSVRFHERFGFREVGRMPGIGRRFGRSLDLVLLQLDLAPAPDPETEEGGP